MTLSNRKKINRKSRIYLMHTVFNIPLLKLLVTYMNLKLGTEFLDNIQ